MDTYVGLEFLGVSGGVKRKRKTQIFLAVKKTLAKLNASSPAKHLY